MRRRAVRIAVAVSLVAVALLLVVWFISQGRQTQTGSPLRVVHHFRDWHFVPREQFGKDVSHYMRALQEKADKRTTATVLALLDYESLAKAFGLKYIYLDSPNDLTASVRGILDMAGPVLVKVPTDYGKRKIRWIEAVSSRFTQELSTQQKVRFAARLGRRAVVLKPVND